MKKYMLIVLVYNGNENLEFYDRADEAVQAFRMYINLISVSVKHLELYTYIHTDGKGYLRIRSV